MSLKGNILAEIQRITRRELPFIRNDVRLYNRQVIDLDGTGEALALPALLIQFDEINFESQSSDVQKAEIRLSLHLVVESFTIDDTTLLSYEDSINQAFHGIMLENIGVMTRIAQVEDGDHDNVIDRITVFEMSALDASAYNRNTIEIPGNTIEFDLTRDLDIDNYIIRTGDGDFT